MVLRLPWEEGLKSVSYINALKYSEYVRPVLIIFFVVVQACKSLATIVLYQKLERIYDDFATFWRRLTSDSQLRWVTKKTIIKLKIKM